MENTKKKINKIKRLLVILGILLIVAITAIVIIKYNPTDRRLKKIYNEEYEGRIEKMPLNVSPLFEKYTGKINQRSIYKAMYIFVDDIVPKYYSKFKKDFNRDNIENYYDKKSMIIEKELGITEKQEFVKFIQELEKIKNSELNLEEYIIVPESINNTNKSLKFVLLIKYEGNSRIAYNLEILNSKKSTRTPINYSGDVNEEYLDYEYQKNTNPIVVIEGKPGKVIN